MRRTLLLGGPGAGKTERLLTIMEDALKRDVKPDRVAFVSFTKAAIGEARTRAVGTYHHTDKELLYFRTLHSLCFQQLNLRRDEVLSQSHLEEFSKLTGELKIEKTELDIDAPIPDIYANILLTIEQYYRTAMVSLEEAHRIKDPFGNWPRLKTFVAEYNEYKQSRFLYDFTDMLEMFVQRPSPVPVELAIVDEAQDLTPLQWLVVERAFSNVQELWVAGDDDQSCYKWAGAAEEKLLGLDWDREVLTQSHRVPREVDKLGKKIVSKISRRHVKEAMPADRQGTVDEIYKLNSFCGVDLSKGTWLLLARTNQLLGKYARFARDFPVAFATLGNSSISPAHIQAIQAYETLRADNPVEAMQAKLVLRALGLPTQELTDERMYGAGDLKIDASVVWHDAFNNPGFMKEATKEYYVGCRQAGEKLLEKPRVEIWTIHGAKGKQAENVVLDLSLPGKTWKGFEEDPDSEHRLFYVGVTRASQNLFLFNPQSYQRYRI